MRKYILLLSLICLTGCGSGVRMNAKFSSLLNHTTDWSIEVADRAAAKKMTEQEMIIHLDQHAQMWRLFRQANR